VGITDTDERSLEVRTGTDDSSGEIDDLKEKPRLRDKQTEVHAESEEGQGERGEPAQAVSASESQRSRLAGCVRVVATGG
jgi:hypothetical protein